MHKKFKVIGFIIGLCLLFFSLIFYKEIRNVLSIGPTAWTDSTSADCAVVLTGGPGRIKEGFDLLAQMRVKKLIISGVYAQTELTDIFPQLPFYGAINPKDVVLEKRSGTTYGNAQQTLPLVEAIGCQNIVLVTSRTHMYRSLRIFKSVFPVGYQIYPRAIVVGSYQARLWDVGLEAFKSLFYSVWAY